MSFLSCKKYKVFIIEVSPLGRPCSDIPSERRVVKHAYIKAQRGYVSPLGKLWQIPIPAFMSTHIFIGDKEIWGDSSVDRLLYLIQLSLNFIYLRTAVGVI